MRRQVLGVLGVLLMVAELPAAGTRIQLVARDLEEHPLSRLRFAYGGVESQATSQSGATQLDLPPSHQPGQQIKVQLMPGPRKAEEWFLVNPQVNIPAGSVHAELVLMRRKEFRKLAAEVRDTPKEIPIRPGKPTGEGSKRALVDAAAHYGLTKEQLETAIRSFADTPEREDQGIAAYLEGRYPQAEEILKESVEETAGDLVNRLRYLGGSQYEQAKYNDAIGSFRVALFLRPADADVLSRLGEALAAVAEWTESETLLRQALALYEKSSGPENPKLTGVLTNLAALLYTTNRMAEAEPLVRRALTIDQKSFGPDHANVARDLENLAALLLATDRSVEAEALLRWALPVTEKRFGPEHPKVAAVLTDLAALLHSTKRMAEAEPLIRRALAIDEKSLGPEHPEVAQNLTDLAALLHSTNRMAEAEPLMRRALAIDEKSLGPEHPNVAVMLADLAVLLSNTDRMAEAEPLLRRALACAEKVYGPDHPEVATNLHDLASLLIAMDRTSEAEPLMRRAVVILLCFSRRTGQEHQEERAFREDYQKLLETMNKSPAEIEAIIEALAQSAR
jgi:tetratricopeptide (TPR) repeat protein